MSTPTPSRLAVVLATSSPAHPRPASRPQSEELPTLVTSDIFPPRVDPRPDAPANLYSPGRKTSAPITQRATPTTQKSQSRPPATEPPKRRGRPVGWRPGMGPYSARADFTSGRSPPPRPKRSAATAAAVRGGMPRRRGRRPARPPRAIYERLKPKFVSFICEWQGCVAELQNLETLRRHVHSVHGASEICLWGKCARGRLPRSLPSHEAFDSHMETVHLGPFSWHAGDGPRNTSSETTVAEANGGPKQLPEYLFDEEGNQVTPSILHQELENEEERKIRRKRLHRLLLQRDRNAPEEPETPVEELMALFKGV